MRRSCAALLGLAAGFLASVAPASAFSPETCTLRRDDGSVLSARLFRPDFAFSQPTRDYAHAVLGDDEEYRGLKVTGFPASRSMMPPEGVDISPMLPESVLEVTLPDTHVFEDIAPRPFDWTGAAFHRLSGVPPLGLNVAVVETDMAQGAALAVYKVTCAGMKKVAATEPIGQSHRWLVPAGIADFDGNGQNDIAYVETPHLAGVLKIVTLAENRLVNIAEPQEGFSNHRIGDDYIVSAVRDCGDGLPELILPDLGWTGLRAVGVENGALRSRAIPGEPSAEGVALAARCG